MRAVVRRVLPVKDSNASWTSRAGKMCLPPAAAEDELTDDACVAECERVERVHGDIINRMPEEMLIIVFGFVDLSTLVTLSKVCRTWARYIKGKQITDVALKTIGADCVHLECLDLRICKQITDAGMAEIAARCPNLKFINLDSCEQITDVALKTIGANCSRLECLGLRNCKRITNAGMAEIATGCPDLKFVNLSYCDKFTDAGLQNMGETYRYRDESLTLHIGWFCGTTPHGKNKSQRHNPKLKLK